VGGWTNDGRCDSWRRYAWLIAKPGRGQTGDRGWNLFMIAGCSCKVERGGRIK